MDLVDKELNIIWKKGKEKTKNKVEWAVHKNKAKDNDPELFKGVLIGDKVLEKYEDKEIKLVTKEKKPCIYGDIKVNEVQEEILLLPPGHQTYPKLKVSDMDLELEKCRIKYKWETMREMRKVEDAKVRNEMEENDVPQKHNIDVDEKESKGVDFRNLKATDLKNNKRVILPLLEEDETEIRGNYLKNE